MHYALISLYHYVNSYFYNLVRTFILVIQNIRVFIIQGLSSRVEASHIDEKIHVFYRKQQFIAGFFTFLLKKKHQTNVIRKHIHINFRNSKISQLIRQNQILVIFNKDFTLQKLVISFALIKKINILMSDFLRNINENDEQFPLFRTTPARQNELINLFFFVSIIINLMSNSERIIHDKSNI